MGPTSGRVTEHSRWQQQQQRRATTSMTAEAGHKHLVACREDVLQPCKVAIACLPTGEAGR